MDLRVPKKFLRGFFEFLFYSILPDCRILGEKSSVILEPICSLKIEDMNIVGWKLIDEWINDSFDLAKVRTRMEEAINHADGSDLEQVLYPPIAKNVFELDDNPFFYPGQRLAEFLYEFLPRTPDLSKFTDGICHFHPIEDADLSESDYRAMRRFASVMERYGKKHVVSLIVAKGDPHKYIEKSTESKSQFVRYMMRDLRGKSFNARVFYPKKGDDSIGVSII